MLFFSRSLHLKQLVKIATRGENILDKVFTNHDEVFSSPGICPPLGKSDHRCVTLFPKFNSIKPAVRKIVYRRDLNDVVIDRIGYELSHVNWSTLYKADDVQSQADFFYSVVHSILDAHASIKEVILKASDKPWITDHFKSLIDSRNRAHAKGDMVNYIGLRNLVERKRSCLQQVFFSIHVNKLKNNDPAKWWKSIKAIGGIRGKDDPNLDNLTFQGNAVMPDDLPETINNFLASIGKGISPVDGDKLATLRNELDAVPDEFIVSEYSVFNALVHLKRHKPAGPDLLEASFLIRLEDVLAAPVCSIVNSSIRQGIVPVQWKRSRVVPIPKCSPARRIESDIRPISITPILAKVAESFIASFVEDHFCSLADHNQFGATKNRSTTLALIKFSHELYVASDNSANLIRILFIDFVKAFDRIDHNVLQRKLNEYDFPRHLIAWSLSFLETSDQFVRIGTTNSSVIGITSGCPQGTVSGPNNFKILINDLTFAQSYIKFVDDVSVVSVSVDPNDQALQDSLSNLIKWCDLNSMNINANKTREMVVCFGKNVAVSDVPVLKCGIDVIQRVVSFKLLGIYFNSELTWKDHVEYILKKVAKRIYFIHLLKRSGVNVLDIVTVYCSIIRTSLEYASPVWHPGLTKAESTNIENVQVRCLKIIFPTLSYSEALFITGLKMLSDRRIDASRLIFGAMKNPDNVLNGLLTVYAKCSMNGTIREGIRNLYPYELPRSRTARMSKSFVVNCIKMRM